MKKLIAVIIVFVLFIVIALFEGQIRMEIIKHTIHSDLPPWLLRLLWGWW